MLSTRTFCGADGYTPGHFSRLAHFAQGATMCRIVHPMRGGSQSHLVECTKGKFWIAKFLGNPQGNRTLVNELIAYRFMTSVRLATPELCVLHMPESLQQQQKVSFAVGNRRSFPQGSLHLGSRCPVNPEVESVFDFLPAKLFSRVSNIEQFAMMFVLDKLLHLADTRQAIFIRDWKVKGRVAFETQFIDHGFVLGASRWKLGDVPAQGLYFQRDVYALIDMRTLVKRAIAEVEALTEEVLSTITEDIPESWFAAQDRDSLAALLPALRKRQANLRPLLDRHLSFLGL